MHTRHMEQVHTVRHLGSQLMHSISSHHQLWCVSRAKLTALSCTATPQPGALSNLLHFSNHLPCHAAGAKVTNAVLCRPSHSSKAGTPKASPRGSSRITPSKPSLLGSDRSAMQRHMSGLLGFGAVPLHG